MDRISELRDKLGSLQSTLEQTRTQRDLLKVTAANAIKDRDAAQTEYAALNEDFMKCRAGNAYLVKQAMGACRQVVQLMRDNLNLITQCQEKDFIIHGIEEGCEEWEQRAHDAENHLKTAGVDLDLVAWCKEETKFLATRDKEFFYMGAGTLWTHLQRVRNDNQVIIDKAMSERDEAILMVKRLTEEKETLQHYIHGQH